MAAPPPGPAEWPGDQGVVLTAPTLRKQGVAPPLLGKECAERGRNVVAEPCAVSINRFVVGEKVSIKVNMVNKTRAGQRIILIEPQSSQFRLRYSKKGRVAPGLAECVWVDFVPDTRRYFYDEIRVCCEDVNFIVPIHAYPTTGVKLRKRIVDFGVCERGQSLVRTIDVESEVAAVALKYKVRLVQDNSQFEILGPLEGTVPADSVARIAIRYRPTRLDTARMRIRVEEDCEENSTPQFVDLLGNAVSPHQESHKKVVKTQKKNAFESAAPPPVPRRKTWKPPAGGQRTTNGRIAIPKQFIQRLATAAGSVSSGKHSEDLVDSALKTQFRRAVDTVIHRQRAARRLALIRAKLGNRWTRAEVAELVATDNEDPASYHPTAALVSAPLPSPFVEKELRPCVFPMFDFDTSTKNRTPISRNASTEELIPASFFIRTPILKPEHVDPLYAALDYTPIKQIPPYFPPTVPRDDEDEENGSENGEDGQESSWSETRSMLDPSKSPDILLEVETAATKAVDDPARASKAIARERQLWERSIVERAASFAIAEPSTEMPSWLSSSGAEWHEGLDLLTIKRADVPYRTPPIENEAAVDWPLRIRHIPRPPTLASRIAQKRALFQPSANAYKDFPEPSRAFRVKTERSPSALSCLSDHHLLRGFDVQAAFPPRLSGPVADDHLSDSESEDEEAFADYVFPTPEACREELGIHTLDDGGENDSKDRSDRSPLRTPTAFSTCFDDQPEGDRVPVVSDIARDRNRLELYRNHTAARLEDEAKLDIRLENIAKAIRDPTLRELVCRYPPTNARRKEEKLEDRNE